MKLRMRFHRPSLLALALVLIASGCSERGTDEMTTQADAGKSDALVNTPLADCRGQLLELAYQTAVKIPTQPHIKARARAQESVVAVCLQLDQPQRALTYLESIPNWRKGAAYADLALYCVRNECGAKAPEFLDLAAAQAASVEDWRKDRIRVKIANTHAWLGQTLKADQLEMGVEASQAGKVAKIKAVRCTDQGFDTLVDNLDALVATGDFDATKNAIAAYSQLYDRFYDNVARRNLLEQKIRDSWGRQLLFLRIETLRNLATFSLDHADTTKALELLEEAQAMIDGAQWRLEHRIGLMARMAEVRFRAGEVEKARSDVDSALAQFDEQGDTIVNIYRARALRPLAEAYQTMGDTPAALAVYKKTVEQGIANPNSRPRAEDLTATCLSMAARDVEPDAELWGRIRQIHKELGQPW